MTIKQQHFFFELVDKLGLNKKEAIEAAKSRYNIEPPKSFTDLTTEQLNPLIVAMEKMLAEEEKTNKLQKLAQQNAQVGDFPMSYRIWDKMMQEMIVVDSDLVIPLDYSDSTRFHIMQWTGRIDDNGKMIYDFDIVRSYIGKDYLVQWSWKDLAWVGYELNADDSMYLASFGKLTVIGNTYSEVKPV